MTTSDADECGSKTLRMQQKWRAGPKYRSILSLVLLKEKRTKKLHKLFGKYDHIINHSIKDVLSSFVVISVIHDPSLHNTGRTVEDPESYSQISGYALILQGAGALQWARQPWLQDTHPGGISKAERRALQPWTCPLRTLRNLLEYYSTGLFSKCFFERKLQWTIKQGTTWFLPMRKAGCSKACLESSTGSSSRAALKCTLSLYCQYVSWLCYIYRLQGCWTNFHSALLIFINK